MQAVFGYQLQVCKYSKPTLLC